MDNLTLPDMRATAVRDLIERSRTEEVALVALAGLDLCALGGPRHAAFPEVLADAWLQLDPEKRQEYTELSVARLARKGDLIPEADGAGSAGYALSPKLGIILAARSRPAYAVIGLREGSGLPLLSMFALGDRGDPVQAVVAEYLGKAPFAQDQGSPLAGLGVLGCLYMSVLVSPGHVAGVLAGWALDPTPRPHRWSRQPDRILTRYNPADEHARAGFRMTVQGNGTTARITGLDPGNRSAPRECDRGGLETVMASLLAGDLR